MSTSTTMRRALAVVSLAPRIHSNLNGDASLGRQSISRSRVETKTSKFLLSSVIIWVVTLETMLQQNAVSSLKASLSYWLICYMPRKTCIQLKYRIPHALPLTEKRSRYAVALLLGSHYHVPE
jgi:hypothetical protein